MISYLIVSLVSGLLFGFLDSLINGNPLARRLCEVYTPIARKTLNVPAGVVIDILYGFIMAGIFLLLYAGLPGGTGIVKGISFALLAWFFRVVMSAASNWITFNVPGKTVIYTVLAGLGEMLVIGIIYGLFLKP